MKRTLCLAPLFWWLACSSSGGGGPSVDADLPTRGGGDGPVAASGCEDAIALCTKLNECAPFLVQAIYGSVAGCTDRLAKVCTEQAGSLGSGMTAGNLAVCKAALQTATCNDVFANNVPSCSFRGTLVDGSTCGDHSQCGSGFCSTGGNLCGTCAPRQAAGGACPSGSNEECQNGLICGSGKTCVAPGMLGGACDDKTQPCLPGTFCTTAKTCALTVQAGQNCPGGYLNLADGTYCTGKDVPAAQIATTPVGKECGLAPGAGLPATVCAPGSVAACTPLPGSINLFGVPTHGQCAALADDGFTCSVSALCQAGAQCIAGTCQIPSGKYCP